ncbi:hypothetical protein EDEG_00682 [Edhazardia aedis USNM 41457]|uniref:Tubulin gamma chain n=1 Tax=Edhazardia aedis (strain USNM 41457) TaxID=1003232 RepID=J9DVA1_EDHAE|nr:hypothetical protein EDEG_00682 [Edhazardia aedis USNM 41457]|eukprot:EJW05217.1 hypothetical protein EDEG_00682 [Edhazardia aedis USNM 41457]
MRKNNTINDMFSPNMREVITVQVGQCGNQIGKEFWNKIAFEHGISKNGDLIEAKEGDRKDAFFYETEDNKFMPRAILVDLEPRVIDSFSETFYNHENVFIDSSGGGAGNNWALGYSKGLEFKEDILDIVQREAECSDNMESFMFMHSIAGGTGSGLGSNLLENIRELYPKKIIQSYSIFPNNKEISDVVVQPYNSMLTLQRLALYSDTVIVIDNGALTRINSKKTDFNNFTMINDLISTVISTSTSTLRFPTHYLSDIRSINAILVPIDRFKFIIPSYTPFINSTVNRRTDSLDILRKLLSKTNRLATTEDSKINKTISIVNILSGMDCDDIQKGVINVLDKGLINFVDWIPPSYHYVKTKLEKRAGLALNNGTEVAGLLRNTMDQFDRLKRKNAFTEMYRKYSDDLHEFDECKEVIQNLIDAYDTL